MTWIIDTKSKRHLSETLAVGLIISTVLAFGTFAEPANAQGRSRNYHHWNGGYYPAPPVVYGSPYGDSYYGYDNDPYRYPPPVVYGPGIRLRLPGVSIGIGR